MGKKEIDKERRQGEELAAIEPRAVGAWINGLGDTPKLCVKLTSGVEIDIPVSSICWPLLANTINTRKVEVTPCGYGLHWEELDFDLAVPQLVISIFHPEFVVAEAARINGQVRSAAKTKAAKANGGLGGRPKTIATKKNNANKSSID